MAELAVEDLPADVVARFPDEETAGQALESVLVSARRYCGWHVSPVKEADELTLDGPAGLVLDLPTGRLTDLTEVVESGTTLDVAKLNWSHNGSVRKRSNRCWTHLYRSVEVTITHGYTEEEAVDWRKAIIDMVAEVSLLATDTDGETSGPLKRKRIDDVEYEWSDQAIASAADAAVYSVASVLDGYRLHSVVFA